MDLHWPAERPDEPRVPMARPVVLAPDEAILCLPYARRPARVISRIRAAVELLLLLPAGLGTGLGVYFIVSALPLDDKRWPSVAEGLGTGLGCVGLCLLFLRIDRQKLAAIGLTTRRLGTDIGLGIAALVLTYLVLAQATIAATQFYPELLAGPSAAQQAIERSFPPMRSVTILVICAWVALWEEIIFRGFLLTRLQVLFKRWWLTVVLAAAAFGVLHCYEGLVAVGLVMLLAVVMSGLFIWRKSLIPSMTYHFLHNVVMFQLLRSVSTTWE